MEAGRKTTKVSRVKCAIATGLTIGKTLTVVVTGPRLGAEQIEQEWCDVWDLTGCEWTACTVPIANTSTTHKTLSAWAIWLRLAGARVMASRFLKFNPKVRRPSSYSESMRTPSFVRHLAKIRSSLVDSIPTVACAYYAPRERTKLSTLTRPAVLRQSQKVRLASRSSPRHFVNCSLPATAAEFGAAGSDPGRSIYVGASDLVF